MKMLSDHAGQDGRGAEESEAEAKNVGIEETNPRHPFLRYRRKFKN